MSRAVEIGGEMDQTVRTSSMGVRVVGRVYVFVHGESAPTDAEWDQVIALYEQSPRLEEIRMFVHTLGAAPNAAQRGRLNAALGKTKPLTSIVTSSAVARAAGTALAWFNPSFRAFGPDEVERALDHLELDARERADVLEVANGLLAEFEAARSGRRST
jgi:hypothetical protein